VEKSRTCLKSWGPLLEARVQIQDVPPKSSKGRVTWGELNEPLWTCTSKSVFFGRIAGWARVEGVHSIESGDSTLDEFSPHPIIVHTSVGNVPLKAKGRLKGEKRESSKRRYPVFLEGGLVLCIRGRTPGERKRKIVSGLI